MTDTSVAEAADEEELIGGRIACADGTEIAYLTLGSGPILLCVHGAFGTGSDWLLVARQLAKQYRVVLMDRRGHGSSSGCARTHSLHQEYDDIAAVIAGLGDEPVAGLLGHSFGACIALSMCLERPRQSQIERIVAIEPPLLTYVTPADVQRFREGLSTGRYERTVSWGFSEVQRIGPRALAAMKHSPRAWAEIVAAAPMMLRHWEMAVALPNLAAFSASAVPTLLIHGSRTPQRPFIDSTVGLHQVLQNGYLEVIDDHTHNTMIRDPGPLPAHIHQFIAASPVEVWQTTSRGE